MGKCSKKPKLPNVANTPLNYFVTLIARENFTLKEELHGQTEYHFTDCPSILCSFIFCGHIWVVLTVT